MKRILWLALVFVLLAFPQPTRADVAPPMNPPGAGPGPEGETTQVRMMAETVLIEVLRNTPAGSLGRAQVTAEFTMRNLGTQSESMAARFPISGSDGFFNFPEIQNLKVQVDGATVATRRTEGPDPNWPSSGDRVPWAEFDVTFPPDQDMQLRVSYTLEGTGIPPYVAYYYVLETGAGWNGTIGSADLIVRLPYEASEQNVILVGNTGWSTTTPGGVFAGREIRWHYEDLEPTRGDNLEISLVQPAAWTAVLTERENVANNSNDGEAWGRLGRAGKDVIMVKYGTRMDAGGQELFDLSVQAYERALELLPHDALWHAGFADLLAVYAYSTAWEGVDTRAEAVRAMQEIKTALDISPDNARVQEIAEQICYDYPDGMPALGGELDCDFWDDTQPYDGEYTFLWLTATPTARATATPMPESTPTRIATRVTPVSSPVPPATSPAPAGASPSPETGAASGVRLPCGAAAMVGFPAAVLLVSRRRPGARERRTDS